MIVTIVSQNQSATGSTPLCCKVRLLSQCQRFQSHPRHRDQLLRMYLADDSRRLRSQNEQSMATQTDVCRRTRGSNYACHSLRVVAATVEVMVVEVY